MPIRYATCVELKGGIGLDSWRIGSDTNPPASVYAKAAHA